MELVGVYQLHGEGTGVGTATRPRNRRCSSRRDITGKRKVDGKDQREEENNTEEWEVRKYYSNGAKLRYLKAAGRIVCEREVYIKTTVKLESGRGR